MYPFTKIPSEKIAPEAFENAIKCGCLLKQQIQGLKSENALPNVYMSRMHNQRSETKNLRWFMCIHYTCCPTVQKPISNYVYSDVVTSFGSDVMGMYIYVLEVEPASELVHGEMPRIKN